MIPNPQQLQKTFSPSNLHRKLTAQTGTIYYFTKKCYCMKRFEDITICSKYNTTEKLQS